MPSKQQEFLFPGLNTEEILLNAYGTTLVLGWKPQYAGPDALVVYTPRNWKKNDDEVMIQATDGKMIVKSSLVHGESFDMIGRNQKHIDEFIAAFEMARSSGIKPEWMPALEDLRQKTIEAATEQAKRAEEVDKVMKFSGSNLYATYGIIGINVLVFILMLISGAGIIELNTDVHIKWGSNFTPLTLTGEWWRLITNIFIHFGIIHIVMNTYALYMAGVYLEPMLGKVKYVIAYLCTGVIASMASLWWHSEGVNSAGASGAIFGLYGVFLALLFTNLIPKQIRVALLQSIGIFVVFNLFYGMKSGIDNAAHIGGLLSGMIIGFIFYLELSGKINVKKPVITLLITALTVTGAWYFLNNYKSDAVRIQQLLNEFVALEKTALQSMQVQGNTSTAEYKERLTNTALPAWKKGLEDVNEMGTLKMSDRIRSNQQKFKKYLELRIEETELLIKAQDAQKGEFDKQIEEVDKKLEEILKEINQ